MQEVTSEKELDNYLNRLKKDKDKTINFADAINLLTAVRDFIKYSHFEDVSNKLSSNLEAEQVINWLEKYISLQNIMDKNKSFFDRKISINDVILIVLPKLKNNLTFDEIENLINKINGSNQSIESSQIVSSSERNPDFKFKYDDLVKVISKMEQTKSSNENLTYFFKIAFENDIKMDWNLFVLIISKFSDFDFAKLVNFYFETFNGVNGVSLITLLKSKIDFENIINLSEFWQIGINIAPFFLKKGEVKAQDANNLSQKALELLSGILKNFFAQHEDFNKSDRDIINEMIIAVLKKFVGGIDNLFNGFDFVNIFSFLYDGSKFFDEFKLKVGELSELALKLSKKDYKKDDIEVKAQDANNLSQKALELLSGILKNFLAKNKELDEPNINMLNQMIIAVLKKFVGGSDDLYNGFDFVNIFSFLYDDSKFFDEFKLKVGELSELALKLSKKDYKKDDIEVKAQEKKEFDQKKFELFVNVLGNFFEQHKNFSESDRNMFNEIFNKCNSLFEKFYLQSNLEVNLEVEFSGFRCDIVENCISVELFNSLLEKIKQINFKLPPLLMFLLIYIVDNLENNDTFKDYFRKNYAEEFNSTNGIEMYQLLYLFKYPQLLDDEILDNFLSSNINFCFLEGNSDLSIVNDFSNIKKDNEHYYWVRFFYENSFSIYIAENFWEFSEVQVFLEKVFNKGKLNLWKPFFDIVISDSDALKNFLDAKKNSEELIEKDENPKRIEGNIGEGNIGEEKLQNFIVETENAQEVLNDENQGEEVTDIGKGSNEETNKDAKDAEQLQIGEMDNADNAEKVAEGKPESGKVEENLEDSGEVNKITTLEKEREEQKRKDKLLFENIKQKVKFSRSKSQEFKSKNLILEYESKDEGKLESKKVEENLEDSRKVNKITTLEKEREEQKRKDKLLFENIKQKVKFSRSKSQEFKSKNLILKYESNIKENKKTNDGKNNQRKRMILFGGLALSFLALTLTISILTFGTGTIPMFVLGSTLIYNSVFGALTAGFGFGFFTFTALLLKNFVSYFRNKSEKSLEVLKESKNSLSNKTESKSNDPNNLSDILEQTNEEKPITTNENFKNKGRK